MHLDDRWLMLFLSESVSKQLVERRSNSIRFRLDLTCQTVLRERETYGENRVDAAVRQSTVSQRCNVS